MKNTAFLNSLLIVFVSFASQVGAQDAAPPPAPTGQILDANQLDQLVGPIALYPDPLIAQILPAATQPSQIAVAYNYVSSGGDPNAIDSQNWDSSVKAVAHYPDVLNMMNGDLQWTAELGQAFASQPSDVMDSVQRLRYEAQNLGNLPSTPQETVETDNGDIDIEPTDPDMIYVPEYDPGIIFYQRPYGRSLLSFGLGFRVGGWLDHDFDWHGHNVIVWGRDHPRPAGWWHEPPAQRHAVINRVGVWHPPAQVNRRAPVVLNRGGDRGFENRDVHTASVREVRAAPEREVRSAPNPVQVHNIPSRPTVSAFVNVQSASAARAASTRGAQSHPSAPSRSSGGKR
jgi:Protein of unknown function (DUF3300)